MKNIILLIIFVFTAAIFADPNATVRTGSSQDSIDKTAITMYYEVYTNVNSAGVVQPTDFNDANSLVYKNFCGALYEATFDANGSDTSYNVDIWYDPPEPNATLTVHKLYLLKRYTLDATATDPTYPIPATDDSSNTGFGHWIRGDIYIGRHNTSHADLDNLKVYIHGNLKK